MPTGTNWQHHFAMYELETEAQGCKPGSYSAFCKVRKNEFAFIRRRHKRDYATCDACDQFRFDKAQPGLTAAKKQQIQQQWDQHLAIAKTELTFMHQNKADSSKAPFERVMLFVDYTLAWKLPYLFDNPEVTNVFYH
jgi:hypothetical protein